MPNELLGLKQKKEIIDDLKEKEAVLKASISFLEKDVVKIYDSLNEKCNKEMHAFENGVDEITSGFIGNPGRLVSVMIGTGSLAIISLFVFKMIIGYVPSFSLPVGISLILSEVLVNRIMALKDISKKLKCFLPSLGYDDETVNELSKLKNRKKLLSTLKELSNNAEKSYDLNYELQTTPLDNDIEINEIELEHIQFKLGRLEADYKEQNDSFYARYMSVYNNSDTIQEIVSKEPVPVLKNAKSEDHII